MPPGPQSQVLHAPPRQTPTPPPTQLPPQVQPSLPAAPSVDQAQQQQPLSQQSTAASVPTPATPCCLRSRQLSKQSLGFRQNHVSRTVVLYYFSAVSFSFRGRWLGVVSLQDLSSLSRRPPWPHGSESAESLSLDLERHPCAMPVLCHSSLTVAASDWNLLCLRTLLCTSHRRTSKDFLLDLTLTAVTVVFRGLKACKGERATRRLTT